VHATATGTLDDRLVLDLPYSGGWSLVPTTRAPRIGDRSSALRVLSERLVDGRYVATLEGLAGRTYAMRVIGPSGAATTDSVTFPHAGANSDGYATMTYRPEH
jgi:hypothetical protein